MTDDVTAAAQNSSRRRWPLWARAATAAVVLACVAVIALVAPTLTYRLAGPAFTAWMAPVSGGGPLLAGTLSSWPTRDDLHDRTWIPKPYPGDDRAQLWLDHPPTAAELRTIADRLWSFPSDRRIWLYVRWDAGGAYSAVELTSFDTAGTYVNDAAIKLATDPALADIAVEVAGDELAQPWVMTSGPLDSSQSVDAARTIREVVDRLGLEENIVVTGGRADGQTLVALRDTNPGLLDATAAVLAAGVTINAIYAEDGGLTVLVPGAENPAVAVALQSINPAIPVEVTFLGT